MYDKATLLHGLSDEWKAFLDNDMLDTVVTHLDSDAIVPLASQVFEFARLTALGDIKVCILDDAPYPKAGYGHGLAFRCLVSVPTSLRNIYKCLRKHKLIETIPKTGDLTRWASQGVLLINCALTTLVGKPNAHKNIWRKYINDLLARLSALTNTFTVTVKSKTKTIQKSITHKPIFMLWGNFAKNKAKLLDSTTLEWSHPSSLVQSRSPFIDCDNFDIVNKRLRIIGAIDWDPLDPVNKVDCGFEMNDQRVVVFTDGSAAPTKLCPEALAGYAATFVLGKFKDVAIYGNIENRPHYASNQRGEGRAILEVLRYLDLKKSEWSECIIVTDSQFWIKMFTTYMPRWDDNDLDFGAKKNPDMTVPMYNLYKKLLFEFGKTIEFRHVRSHDKDGWSKFSPDSYEYFCWFSNDYVDELAGFARKSMKPGKHLVDLVEYD